MVPVAWRIANGAVKSGLDLTIFLTNSAVDGVIINGSGAIHQLIKQRAVTVGF